jgi:coenzyme F420 hydrogenase subunit beta
MIPIRNATDVARWNLCNGCGACVYACQNDRIALIDMAAHGLRPVLEDSGSCASCNDCVTVCPGMGIDQASGTATPEAISTLSQSWGPVLDVWEGHATDASIRHLGSSGGLATALALFCIEQEGMRGVVHIGSDDETRYLNASRFSRTPAELLASTGSRYSPASPCDSLQAIEDAGGPCVFIGKPCDVHGLRKAQHLRAGLNVNVGLAIGIFCAGTPSTQGTLDLLHQCGVDPQQVADLRYRGRGWPGTFAVRRHGQDEWHDLATYEQAWGFLQKYRPYRCHLCPDGTSEFADLSCGDPWYREIRQGDEGRSLLLVRTEAGRQIVHAAMAGGYVTLEPVQPEVLLLSQRELQLKRGAIWGRLLTMNAAGIPVPKFSGFSLFRNWLQIPFAHKLRSLVGTARRIVARRYFRPLDLDNASLHQPFRKHHVDTTDR